MNSDHKLLRLFIQPTTLRAPKHGWISLVTTDPIQALTNQAQNLLDIGDPTNMAYLLAFLTSALKQNSGLSIDVTSTETLPVGTVTATDNLYSQSNGTTPTTI